MPKSPEHREAISVAQRRRHTVTGILRAVESVHSAEEASTSYIPRSSGRFVPEFSHYKHIRVCCAL